MSDNMAQIEAPPVAQQKLDTSNIVAPNDMSSHQAVKQMYSSDQATNSGKNVLPDLQLFDPGDAHSPQATAAGSMIDKAIAANSPQDLERAAQSISALAKQTVEHDHGSTANLQKLAASIDTNVKSDGKGVDIEVEGNKIVTHISQLVTLDKYRQMEASGKQADVRDVANIGMLTDLVPAVKTDLPATKEQASTNHSNHKLEPGDTGLITDLSQKQATNLGLSLDSEQKLEHALTLVAGSGSQDSLDKLGQMMPDLMTGSLGHAFKNALSELGYNVKSTGGSEQAGRDSFDDNHYALQITEPNKSRIGGTVISMNWDSPNESHPNPQIAAVKYSLR